MVRPTPATANAVFLQKPAPPRRPRLLSAAVLLLVTGLAPAALSQPSCAPDDQGGSGFTLVAQALRARLHLVYVARQDILWTMPPPADGMAQVVADIARQGSHTGITYLLPTEAAGRVMLDDGVRSSLYDPANRALIVGPSAADDRAAASPATLALLRRNYRCSRLSPEALDGRLCDVIAVRPRVEGRPSKLLWIDGARHAILRTEEYDAQGCRRYVSFYRTIRFLARLPAHALDLPGGARGPSTQRISVQSSEAASPAQAFATTGVAGRLPAWCPWGFTLMRCSVIHPRPGSRAVLLHYSDGLKSLLVMEETRTGVHPTASELNGALARYGQQAWVRQEGPLRTVVRGDLSLPDALGAEMMQALGARSDALLARGLARDFGPAAARRGTSLRRKGWGYEQIGALCLWEKGHPDQRARLKRLLDKGALWPRVSAVFGAETASLTGCSRAWVAATLAAPH